MSQESFVLNCEFKIIEVSGRKVQTYAIGSGDKVILSFPAYPHSGLIYSLFMLNYDLTKVKLITFDLPGWIGMTENTGKKEVFDLGVIADIVDGIIKEYKIEKFNVIGYSYGALLALETANRFDDKVEKVVLVSPIIKRNLIIKSDIAMGVKILKLTRLHTLMMPYIKYRFNKYKKVLVANGIPQQFVYSYKEMMKRVNSRMLLDSLYALLFSDHTNLLENMVNKKVLIASSKNENSYFKKQSGYIRQTLNGEKSLYLDGEHHDFILNPQKEIVRRIVNFLIS